MTTDVNISKDTIKHPSILDKIVVPTLATAFYYPLHRYQTFVQTAFSTSSSSQSVQAFKFNYKNLYHGGSPIFAKCVLFSVFGNLGPLVSAACYPLEVLQIKAAAYGSEYKVNFGDLKSFSNLSQWHGFRGAIASYCMFYISMLSLKYAPFISVLLTAAIIPVDNVRRNFTIQRLNPEALQCGSYMQVYEAILAKDGFKGLFKGFQAYPALLLTILFMINRPSPKKKLI